MWRELCDRVGWNRQAPFTDLVRHHINREIIGLMVTDVVTQTAANLHAAGVDSLDAVQTHAANLVGYSETFAPKIRALKTFLYQRMYRHYRLMRMQVKAERFIADIFEAYSKDPGMLPPDTQARLAEASVPRVVADYIAGMTDRYALDEHEKLFSPYRRV